LYVTPDGQLYPNQAVSIHGQRQAMHRLLGQGQLYRATGQLQRAKDVYGQAFDIAKASGFRREEAAIAWNLGQLYADTDPAKAVELMSIYLAYQQELDRAIAESDAQVVEQLKATL
jgi:tetratricopeptide (TPR) repeat protein